MSLPDYQSLLGKVRGTQLVYLEDMTRSGKEDGEGEEGFLERHDISDNEDSNPNNPVELLRNQRLRAALVKAIESLPEREQYIMGMYYEHDMNLKEIAAVLDVTESRICQLHSQSIARLRAKMRSH
jgi:RNA polymerase sigma factor for flagellar operon FliA